ncbi:MAG: FliI/YscN family ATPase [Pseudomonadota bacterium]
MSPETDALADPFADLRLRISDVRSTVPIGRVTELSPAGFAVEGLSALARLGDELRYEDEDDQHRAEIVKLDKTGLLAVPMGPVDGLRLGLPVELTGPATVAPHDAWVGRIVDPFGEPLDDGHLTRGAPRKLAGAPPAATRRRAMGERVHTGYAVLDTVLPLARGQRIGLFAGSGVGKSTLLGGLARNVEADICVLALVGERGREVSDFVRDVLGPEGMARTIVVAATSDMSAPMRRRCAQTALAVAEHFRDAGRHVLFLCDSVTRLAEAHREIATAAGEDVALRGHPASLTPLLAALAERAGPGADGQGDITAIFSVLVAGSDMEEPVADIVRGQLDGHVVLSRAIAEAGRFPAVDVLQSVSRCLPAVATDPENAVIAQVRRLLDVQARNELMISSGLYEAGANAEIDRAIAVVPRIEGVFAERDTETVQASFEHLAGLLGADLRTG